MALKVVVLTHFNWEGAQCAPQRKAKNALKVDVFS